jgi:hypothetical protein
VKNFVLWDVIQCSRIIVTYFSNNRSRDSSVGILTGYGLDGRGVGVRVRVGARFVFSPRRPDRFWGPPSPVSAESYFSGDNAAGS